MSDKSGRIGTPKRAFVPVDDKEAAKARDSEKSPEKETASASLKTDLNRAHRPENSSSSASSTSTSAMTVDDYPDTTKPTVSTKVPDRSSATANNPRSIGDEHSANGMTSASQSSAVMPQNDLLLSPAELASNLERIGYDQVLGDNPTPTQLNKALSFVMGHANPNLHALFLSTIVSLVANGADVNTYIFCRPSALNFAALCGHLDAVKFLTSRGAHINAKDGRRSTPLDRAIVRSFPDPFYHDEPIKRSSSERTISRPTSGQVDVIRFLVSLNADIGTSLESAVRDMDDGRGHWRAVPPERRATKEHVALIQFLLDHGFHSESLFFDDTEDGPVSTHVGPLEVIETYKAARACKDINFDACELLNSSLHWFAAQTPAASTDTSSSATSSASTTSSSTTAASPAPSLEYLSLHSVCESLLAGNFSIESIAPLIVRVAGTSSAIRHAVIQALALAQACGEYATEGHPDQVDHGVRIALQDAGLWNDYLGMREKFATVRNNIDRYQTNGQTLLTQAAFAGDIEMIRILVRLGANVQLPDQTGHNAAAVAASAGQLAAVTELLSHGINANNANRDGRSALYYVAQAIADSNGPDIEAMASLVRHLLLKGYRFDAENPEAYLVGSTLTDILTSNPERLLALGPELIAQLKKP